MKPFRTDSSHRKQYRLVPSGRRINRTVLRAEPAKSRVPHQTHAHANRHVLSYVQCPHFLDFGLAYGPTTRHSGGLVPFFLLLLSDRADEGLACGEALQLAKAPLLSSPTLFGEE